MPNTVIALKSSGVSTNVPDVGTLANGELALNFADGLIYYKTDTGTLGTIGSASPGGLDTEIQFNDSGSFGGNSNFTFNKTIATLNVTNINVSTNIVAVQIAAGSGGYFQFPDGSRQFTANAGGGGAVAPSSITGVMNLTQGGANNTTYTTGAILTSNGTAFVSLANTGTADTYANASHVPVITTDAYGRVSAVTNTVIAIDTSQITSGTLAVARGGTGVTTSTGTGAVVLDTDPQLFSLGVGTPSSGVEGEIRAANDVTAFYSSDIRLKENRERRMMLEYERLI